MERICSSLGEVRSFAKEIVSITKSNNTRATVLTLKGDLGSGKTTFTKFVAEILGVKDIVTSPTFVIQKVYNLEGQLFDKMVHIDAYRLESGEGLKSIGWDDLINNSRNIILVEWPEKVLKDLPENTIKISFETLDENTRKIILIENE